ITNRTFDYLHEMFIGIYADLDAGPRDRGTYQMDDRVGYWEGKWCAPEGLAEYPVWMKLSYVFDSDGDDGRTESYFGLLILGYTTSIDGLDAPRFPSYEVRSFRHFQGLLPYVNGGDPANDYQRYEAMSGNTIDEDTDKPGDYRVLMTVGEFPLLEPGRSFVFDVAFVAGRDFEDMLDNAAVAKKIYDGVTYDLDRNASTGVRGRETPIPGPIEDMDPDLCDGVEQHFEASKGETLWVNLDCAQERAAFLDRDCYKQGNLQLADYSTGVDGKEGRLNWVTACAPTPPRMRVVPGHRSVAVLWDNLSEVTPDPFTLEYDFEGYMVWRADDWKRPLGTNETTGPGLDLWTLLETRDITNGVLPDNEFRHSEAIGGWRYTPLAHIDAEALEEYVAYFREFFLGGDHDYDIPCPEGLTEAECDTIEAQERMRLGLRGGRRYYRYLDDTAIDGMHYFYSVVAQDHILRTGVPWRPGRYNSPATNFVYAVSSPGARTPDEYDTKEVYVVPNPVTADRMQYWTLGPVNEDASGLKVEFRNLPRCRSKIRIYTVSGDLVQTIEHDGSDGDGSAAWNLVSRNGQDVTS
ncbi:MAG TPA: hypothetical protein VLA34_04440, partial [Candidatus Krumholzibacterium sp.]|nr:hypothetical protein [Candidatus Krumholzibacterium sp.]